MRHTGIKDDIFRLLLTTKTCLPHESCLTADASAWIHKHMQAGKSVGKLTFVPLVIDAQHVTVVGGNQ